MHDNIKFISIMYNLFDGKYLAILYFLDLDLDLFVVLHHVQQPRSYCDG